MPPLQTLYLNEVAGLDESVGSRYLLVGSLVKMGACVTVGAVAKRKLLTPAQVRRAYNNFYLFIA